MAEVFGQRKLLDVAGAEFAILGARETCTGEPARRLGSEFLFQMQAAQNVETLNSPCCWGWWRKAA